MYWLKSLRWVKTAGIVIAAILLALAGQRAIAKKASARKKEDVGTHMMNSGISKKILAGKKMVEAANKDKDKAIEAEKVLEAQLEKMGQGNESIADIADRFNKRKLRRPINSSVP